MDESFHIVLLHLKPKIGNLQIYREGERNWLNGLVSKVYLMMLAARFSMVSQMAARRTLKRWELLSPQSTTRRGHSHLAEFSPSSEHCFQHCPAASNYICTALELGHTSCSNSSAALVFLLDTPGRQSSAKVRWQSTQYVYSLQGNCFFVGLFCGILIT